MRIYNAWNRGGLTSEWVEVKGKWRLWQKYSMKLVTELECTGRHDGGAAGKWKYCAKRIAEKEGGRLKLLPVISAHLRLKNISSAIGRTKHPRSCSRSPSFNHMRWDADPRTPRFKHRATAFSLSASVVALWVKGNQAWNMDRLFQHTAVYYTTTTLCCRSIQWKAYGQYTLVPLLFPFRNDFI